MEHLRPSPAESAKLFPRGTKKKGSDGNMWVIEMDKNGTKRWKKFMGVEIGKTRARRGPVVELYRDVIAMFSMPPIKKMSKIGKFSAPLGVAVGESCIGHVKPLVAGEYVAYNVNNSLVIVHSSIPATKKLFQEAYWNHQKLNIKCGTRKFTNIPVDGGTCGFWAHKIVKNAELKFPSVSVAKIALKQVRKGILINGIYTKNTLPKFRDADVGVLLGTGGDGAFQCFVSGNKMALILGDEIVAQLAVYHPRIYN